MKLQEYGLKAMENAVRSLGLATKDRRLASRLKLSLGERPLELASVTPKTCAIPLLTVPVDASIDPRIAYKLTGPVPGDSMPAVQVMPVCVK